VLLGLRRDVRPLEFLAQVVFWCVNPLLLEPWRVPGMAAGEVAAAMLERRAAAAAGSIDTPRRSCVRSPLQAFARARDCDVVDSLRSGFSRIWLRTPWAHAR